jgi:flagellar biosynthesis/type III secretory pathway M-ring protein FliF/YscJ
MVTAAATIVSVLVLGIFVTTWQAIRATRMREAAQTAQASESQQRQRAEADERSAQQQLYVAKMNLARLAWDQNNLGRLEKLLEETANNPTRGFEGY